MPGLDEFYRYLERDKPEKKPRAEPVPPPGPEPGVRYIVRKGITIAVPVGEDERETPPAKAPAPKLPAPEGAPLSVGEDLLSVPPLPPARPATDGEAAALWERLPRHTQILASLAEAAGPAPVGRTFEETRGQLVHRLIDPVLTLEETARLLDVCTATVRRYTNRGQLPHMRTIGQQRRFRLSEVLAFLERRAVRTAPDEP